MSEMDEDKTKIYCTAIVCLHNDSGTCTAETIHLQACAPDADNILACSEFEE